ncbi:Protein phosphatase inhibitor [Cinara cedri]|uniref:E3 ubiquitin-protein ligase PPP1R11 n=1 Tax=Cinara cedri TaxID=506608 RepID=A0A5E4NMX1_9HEMI|nr:Protein phosphatase inhibitor [Cinara cedri]
MEETNLPLPSNSATVILQPQATDNLVVHLKLKKPKNNHKQVSWDAQTVDNEHLDKKKSKCCCIYEKPKKYGDPDEDKSDESDNDECDSCMGKKKTHQLHRPAPETQKEINEDNC